MTITVKSKNQEYKIQVRKENSLLESLRKEGLFIPAVCAGRGTCGKCRIRVLEGDIPETDADRKCFSAKELNEGYRLACRAYPQSDCTILVDDSEKEEFMVQASETSASVDVSLLDEKEAYGIAADIGTTTVAMQLIGLETGKTVQVYTSVNRQRAYGADVISRIEASNAGKGEELAKIIRDILWEGILELTHSGAVQVKRMVVGGNTTMIHLLMGYSCETLGVYPFTPVNISTIHTTGKELFGERENDFDIVIYPGISAYVGGDIVAGLYALDFQKREEISLLVDLGTNGELVIGNKKRLLAASTAAGPAFEGGNIICGIGSVRGAICKVEMEAGNLRTETIGNVQPRGICGTGVIDCTYELVKAGIVDETGLMETPYFETGVALSEDGKIRFYQKDVRELQLAKAAVRAGVETLLLRYGITWDEVGTVYLAGGFGHQIDIHKAVGIGLLPKACETKVETVGNTCLKGAVKYLMEREAPKAVSGLIKVSEEINLSNDIKFQELYMESFGF